MNPTFLVSSAFKSIWKHRSRSALTALGVIIGVASVVVMVSIGQGAENAIRSQIDALGTNLVVITPGAQKSGGVSGGAGSYNRLSVEDAELLSREAQTLSAVTPVVSTRSVLVVDGVNWRANVLGVDHTYDEIRDWTTSSGGFFSDEDVSDGEKVVVLGATVADELFADADPAAVIGSRIRVGDLPVTVVGVLATKGQTPDGADQDDVVLMPYTTVQTRMSGRQRVDQILASAMDAEQLPQALIETQELMRVAHDLSAGDADDTTVRDQSALADTATGTTEVMSWLLMAVASVSLLVGGIGIMNIMLVSVTERTREIGIRRALGARGSDVLAQFLVESTVLSALGGLIGVALGAALAFVIGAVAGWATSLDPTTAVIAVLFSAAVGIFFGWAPARRAASLDVIDALRHQ